MILFSCQLSASTFQISLTALTLAFVHDCKNFYLIFHFYTFNTKDRWINYVSFCLYFVFACLFCPALQACLVKSGLFVQVKSFHTCAFSEELIIVSYCIQGLNVCLASAVPCPIFNIHIISFVLAKTSMSGISRPPCSYLLPQFFVLHVLATFFNPIESWCKIL